MKQEDICLILIYAKCPYFPAQLRCSPIKSHIDYIDFQIPTAMLFPLTQTPLSYAAFAKKGIPIT